MVGENGSGKSTFIKVLAGYHMPDPGAEVSVNGMHLKFRSPESAYNLGCRFVHQDLGLLDDLTVLDNVNLTAGFPTRFGTITTREARQVVKNALAIVGLDVDPSVPVAELSSANKTGVAVARALRRDTRHVPHLLVLDEPTATMPEAEVEHLLEIVRQVAASGIGILYVSHRLDEIFRVCDHVTVLRDGVRVATRPVGELDRLTLVNLLVGEDFQEAEEATKEASRHLTKRSSEVALKVEGLAYEGLKDFDLEVETGTITGIAGLTGSGREVVLSAVFGAVQRDGGRVIVGEQEVPPWDPAASIRHGLAYLPPDRRASGGMFQQSARANMTILRLRPFSRRGHIRLNAERREVGDWFERLAIRPSGAMDAPLASFSGGNQQKVLFAKWMRLPPTVLLLDEPTQGVDIGAKALLHYQLVEVAQRGGTVVVSSSDVEELAAVCDRVLIMRYGRVAEELHSPQMTPRGIARACVGSEGRPT